MFFGPSSIEGYSHRSRLFDKDIVWLVSMISELTEMNWCGNKFAHSVCLVCVTLQYELTITEIILLFNQKRFIFYI